MGNRGEIRIGWYQDNQKNGNCILVNAKDSIVIDSGFYMDGK